MWFATKGSYNVIFRFYAGLVRGRVTHASRRRSGGRWSRTRDRWSNTHLQEPSNPNAETIYIDFGSTRKTLLRSGYQHSLCATSIQLLICGVFTYLLSEFRYLRLKCAILFGTCTRNQIKYLVNGIFHFKREVWKSVVEVTPGKFWPRLNFET